MMCRGPPALGTLFAARFPGGADCGRCRGRQTAQASIRGVTMKDLNELMQAILDMDAAQRKAADEAQSERTARLAGLDEERRHIAEKAAPDGKARADAAAKQASEANNAALEELAKNRAAAEQNLQQRAEACTDQWVDELCRRALAGTGAGGEA